MFLRLQEEYIISLVMSVYKMHYEKSVKQLNMTLP